MGKESEGTVVLTFDGQVGFDLHHDDMVQIHKSRERSTCSDPLTTSYFKILKDQTHVGRSNTKD